MEPAKKVSKTRVLLTWVMMIGMVIIITSVFFLGGHQAAAPSEETGGPQDNPFVHAIFYFVVGVLFLGCGLVGYFVTLYTCCLTFNFQQPVWLAVKSKKYLFNILVTSGLTLGLGFLISAFLGPFIAGFGIPITQVSIGVIMVVLIVFSLAQLWVLMWSPLEKRVIMKRLGAMGITPQQTQGAALIGISNPASGTVKRFGAIEEDMGALWVAPDRLAFRGDVEQFDLMREQIVQIERRADNRSTSVLAGIAHVILHVQLPDGNIRQLRLHTEGLWTLGKKRRAMDELAENINAWYEGRQAPVASGQ